MTVALVSFTTLFVTALCCALNNNSSIRVLMLTCLCRLNHTRTILNGRAPPNLVKSDLLVCIHVNVFRLPEFQRAAVFLCIFSWKKKV